MNRLIYTPKDGKPFVSEIPDMEKPVVPLLKSMYSIADYHHRMDLYHARLSLCRTDIPFPEGFKVPEEWEPDQEITGMVEYRYQAKKEGVWSDCDKDVFDVIEKVLKDRSRLIARCIEPRKEEEVTHRFSLNENSETGLDCQIVSSPSKEVEPVKEEEITNKNIDSLLSEFNRQGFNTENWDGDEGWEKAIVDGVRNHISELSEPPSNVSVEEAAKDAAKKHVDYSYENSDNKEYFDARSCKRHLQMVSKQEQIGKESSKMPSKG